MSFLATLGTGLEVLGGIKSLFSKPKQKVTDMSAVRASYEKGGYNPLAGAGAMQTSFGPQFGGVNGFEQIGEALISEAERKSDLEMAERELEIREAALDRTTQSLGSRTQIGAVASSLANEGAGDVVDKEKQLTDALSDESKLTRQDGRVSTDVMKTNDVPSVRAFGINWDGSGAFSSGETYEAAGGEPLQWAMAPFSTADLIFNKSFNFGQHLREGVQEKHWNNQIEETVLRRDKQEMTAEEYDKKYPPSPWRTIVETLH